MSKFPKGLALSHFLGGPVKKTTLYLSTTTVSKVLYHWLVQASLLIVKIQTDLDDQAGNKIVVKKKMLICEVFLIPPKRYHLA